MAAPKKKVPAKKMAACDLTERMMHKAPKIDEKKQKVIDVLNEARSMELYAIVQYMNQHYGLDDQYYEGLAGKVKEIAIDEMKHAELFAERIKDLDGEPTAKPSGLVEKRQDVRDVFRFDAGVEEHTIKKYNEFIKVCRESGDQVSANLFERIIDEEQGHSTYFDDVANHIERLGDHYLGQNASS